MPEMPAARAGPKAAAGTGPAAAQAQAGTPRVDATDTWKPYQVAYEAIKALRALETGATVEVLSRDDPGLLTDLATWCEAAGHQLVASERPAPGRHCR